MNRYNNQKPNHQQVKTFTEEVKDKQISLACNYFRFEMLNKQNAFFKYSIDISPDIPQDSKSLRGKVWNSAKGEIEKKYGNTIYNNTLIYCQINNPNDEEINTTFNDTNYKIAIKWVQTIEKTSFEFIALFKKFYNILLKKLSFIQIRRNYYNPNKSVFLQSFGDLEIWPGFISSVNQFKDGAMLNIETSHRLIRTDTALDIIKQMMGNNRKNDANEHFKGCVVITRYNGDKSYILDGIDFSKTPADSFSTKDGNVTFYEYYLKKYGKQIRTKDQPLLIHKDKKTNSVCYLVPELCVMSGISDEMRQNFNLMKEISKVSQGNAKQKIDACKTLIKHFNENQKCKDEMNRWGIKISQDPLFLNAFKMDAGNILLAANEKGERNAFNLEAVGSDLDRRIQAPMYSQPSIRSWIVSLFMK